MFFDIFSFRIGYNKSGWTLDRFHEDMDLHVLKTFIFSLYLFVFKVLVI
jgi:hypothetical protein